jgi:predicted phage-related endonuclease
MPPAEKGSNGVWQKSEEYKKADDERVIDVQKYSDALDRREEITQLIKRLEDEKKGIEQDIKAYMGDAAMATSQRYRVDWKNVNSSKIDTDLLKKEYREVYDKCLKKTTTRRFSIKRISE